MVAALCKQMRLSTAAACDALVRFADTRALALFPPLIRTLGAVRHVHVHAAEAVEGRPVTGTGTGANGHAGSGGACAPAATACASACLVVIGGCVVSRVASLLRQPQVACSD